MSQELSILKHFLLSRKIQYKYHQNIKLIKNLQKEYKTLYARIDEIYQLFPEKQAITPDEMKTYLAYKMPSARDLDFLEGLVDSAFEIDLDEGITELVMQQLAEKYIASQMIMMLTPVIEGSKFEQIPKAVELGNEYNDLAGALTGEDRLTPCETSLVDLIKEKQDRTGLTWPLAELQKAMGDASYGQSGLIFARPETGKSSLGLSLAAHWARCMAADEDWLGLYLGFEEKIQAPRLRYHQSILGVTQEQIEGKPEAAMAEAIRRGSERFKFFGNIATTRDIEQICKRYGPRVIIIDQTSKIYKPGQPDSEVQRLAQIFLWVRHFAKENNLLAVNLMQAAASAENKQWLWQTDMHNSKTDVAGETDWAAGIGKVNEPGMEYARFINLCRNKGGPHVGFQSYFDFNRCKYYNSAPKQQKGKP